ncbi:VIT1/CCC1 transporter family protein [bacterium]|nr:VIT1/CCC1 transporter family protein [bacterium]MCI0566318.1 VIT1/CCC1 transporter family protein [bacterium]MCI0679793.1 VIT1/CCC1 transporter family protein [bacterium]
MRTEHVHRKNSDYEHHERSRSFAHDMREVVFGMEDGMVSTLGTLTGIAVGSGDLFTVVLAGIVIVMVESISMAVGTYASSHSERSVEERKLYEEKTEISEFPEEEKHELLRMYVRDGWPEDLAGNMAETASHNKALMLKEMAYRELSIVPENMENPVRNAGLMFIAYVFGGLFPVSAYFFMKLPDAIFVSIFVTLTALFVLGAMTAKFTKENFTKAGLRMLVLGSVALIAGYFVGKAAEIISLYVA